jgi:hypothetical protein
MYAILRARKIKNRCQLTFSARHNFRLRSQRNVNGDRSHLNQILYNSLGINTKSALSCQKRMTDYYRSLGIKERENNVLMYEYVATASPEFFKELSPEKVEKWAGEQVDFIKSEFGNQLKLAVLHLDEKTPHLHFYVSTEMKSVKRYRNRYGTSEKETWTLNSKRYDPEFLRALQDRYAEANKSWGLRRGVHGSMRRNVSLKSFYKMIDRVMSTTYKKQIDQIINGIELTLGERRSIETIREKVREHLAPFMNNMAKQQKALKAVVKLDMHRLQVELLAERKRLKQEETDIAAMREVYAEAINSRLLDIQASEVILGQNVMLLNEVERLRTLYESGCNGGSGKISAAQSKREGFPG